MIRELIEKDKDSSTSDQNVPLTVIRRYSYSERLERVERLKDAWPFTAEVLMTCAEVLQFQQNFRTFLDHSQFRDLTPEQQLPQRIDLVSLLPKFRDFLRMMSASATEVLVEAATLLETRGTPYWEDSLTRFWNGTASNRTIESFFLHAFLQPIAESFAESSDVSAENCSRSTCPYCCRKPVCGVLRPLGDGAKRSLICSFCNTEWDYRRLVCPSCEQENVEFLPVYTAEGFAYIRIEACELCKSFIKTIDLTQQGRAVPVIDEIGSPVLTLWAEQKGYRKLERNLLFT